MDLYSRKNYSVSRSVKIPSYSDKFPQNAAKSIVLFTSVEIGENVYFGNEYFTLLIYQCLYSVIISGPLELWLWPPGLRFESWIGSLKCSLGSSRGSVCHV